MLGMVQRRIANAVVGWLDTHASADAPARMRSAELLAKMEEMTEEIEALEEENFLLRQRLEEKQEEENGLTTS